MQAANIKSKIPIYKLYEPSFAVPFLISTTTQVLRTTYSRLPRYSLSSASHYKMKTQTTYIACISPPLHT